jgi:hypothetical protein
MDRVKLATRISWYNVDAEKPGKLLSVGCLVTEAKDKYLSRATIKFLIHALETSDCIWYIFPRIGPKK